LKRKTNLKKKNSIKEWLKAIAIAFFIILFIRILFFEAFTIPSSSMESTLLTGDYILVNKFKYGARLPITPIAFPFFHQYLPFTENTFSFNSCIHLPYFRAFGTPNIKRRDVVVFNYPMDEDFPIDQRTYFIKRCVGLPGDTLQVKRSLVWINNKLEDDTSQLEFNYRLICNTDTLSDSLLHALNITEGGKLSNKGEFWFTLSEENKQILLHQKNVIDAIKSENEPTAYNDFLFPENKTFVWNIDYYGPLVIPQKGDSVKLSIDSLALYKRIIVNYEHNQLFIRHDSIFINNLYATHYVFKNNYYFMMGDNRHNSTDSRFWGFVPETHLVGKATYVLMSLDKTQSKTKIRWNRVWKKIK
jgi:signal peptidase I